MQKPVKVINGKLICLKQNHNDPVEMIVMDAQVPLHDRLLCLRCFKAKRQISKYISIEEAQELIQEKIYKLNSSQEEQKKRILLYLNEFQNKIQNIKSRVIQQIDETLRISKLWITDITNIGRKPDLNYFLEDLSLLDYEVDQNQLNKSNVSHQTKIDIIIQKLITNDDYKECQNILKNILLLQDDQKEKRKIKIIELENYNMPIVSYRQDKQLHVKLMSCEKYGVSHAIAFNNSGSIMVSGTEEDIELWNFKSGKMISKIHIKKNQKFQQNELKSTGKNLEDKYGPEEKRGRNLNFVLCLVFSKKHNWFVSGSSDGIIMSWKQNGQLNWANNMADEKHSKPVFSLILNTQEDQLISCSGDCTIKVWRVYLEMNLIKFDQTLEHSRSVNSISLNESGTALVSCSQDQKIILWKKSSNNVWQKKHEITMEDIGYRICFINENQIIWQQSGEGITHFLEIMQGELQKRSNLNITLNQTHCDNFLFPTLKNKKKSIIIQKHGSFVYILQQQANGSLQMISEPIDCGCKENYGALTGDGEYLTIWNLKATEFRVYKITYE